MNILVIAHERNLNGASKSLLNIIDLLCEQHKFYVILPFDRGEVYNELKKRNIEILYTDYKLWIQTRQGGSDLKTNWYFKYPIWHFYWKRQNQKIVRKIYDLTKKMNIDVIHTNSSVIDLGGQLSKLSGIPHIWHIREMGKEDFNLEPFEGWEKAYQFMYENSNKIICISEAVYNRVAANMSMNHCVRIYNGVGKENIYSRRKYKENYLNKFKILVAGAIQVGKRQDIAINAVRELHQNGYSQVELYVAGRGSIENIGIKANELEPYIKILGQVNNLSHIRKDMDIEVVCSTCEAFGRVTVEAMMSGMPVIASNTGGSPELVKNGQNGLLFEAGDAHDLASKIEFLINHADEIKRMGRNAYFLAKESFTIERCACEIERVYLEVTNRT